MNQQRLQSVALKALTWVIDDSDMLKPNDVHRAAVVVQISNSCEEPKMDDFCSMGRNQGCFHSSGQCSP